MARDRRKRDDGDSAWIFARSQRDLDHWMAYPMSADRPEGPEIMRFFAYDHLPEKLQRASKPFHLLARHIVDLYPPSAERSVCLRHLLTAKDASVRCQVMENENES